MHAAVMAEVDAADVFIAAAAVSDYRPESPAATKIKKSPEALALALVPNPDILADVAARAPRPFVVGFAAETGNLEGNARAKLDNKKLDMIAANLVGGGRGFDRDDNALTVYWPGGSQDLGVAPKAELAGALIGLIAARLPPADGG
jgi:phosphopantothenoylcysteine decarboxylase/phosphopantothenate--cysteine ligase